MSKFDAIMFDFDGVLMDSEPLHYRAWVEVGQAFNIQLDWNQYQKHCVGLHDTEVVAFLASIAMPVIPPDVLWREFPRKQRLFVQTAVATGLFSEKLTNFLKSLGGYQLAVVTSCESAEVEPLLEVGRIRHLFAAVVCAEDVPRHKPAPDPYLHAAKLLSASRPLVVEDSEAGMASAAAAGYEAVRVRHPDEVPNQVLARLSA